MSANTDRKASETARCVIDGARARSLIADGGTLLDVRTTSEYAEQHIDGAINIPLAELEARLSELYENDEPLVIYCRSGRRSALALARLRKLDFERVYDLGPMTAWSL